MNRNEHFNEVKSQFTILIHVYDESVYIITTKNVL